MEGPLPDPYFVGVNLFFFNIQLVANYAVQCQLYGSRMGGGQLYGKVVRSRVWVHLNQPVRQACFLVDGLALVLAIANKGKAPKQGKKQYDLN